MARPLLNGSIVQVIVESQLNRQTMLNILHYRYDGSTAPDYTVVCADLRDKLIDTDQLVLRMADCCSEETFFRRLYVQPVWTERLAAIVATTSFIGAVAGPALPQNCAGVITKRSDFATRWGVGGIHVGGLPITFGDKGELSAAAFPPFIALGDYCSQPVNAGGAVWTPVLWNINQPDRVTVWDRFQLQETLRVMRRRTVGVGV